MNTRGVLARADLLEALLTQGSAPQDFDWFALALPGSESCGYQRVLQRLEPPSVVPESFFGALSVQQSAPPETSKRAPLQVAEFWTVTEDQQHASDRSAPETIADLNTDALPVWMPPDPHAAEQHARMWRRAGVSAGWPKLRAALRAALQRSVARAPLDWPELVRRLARAQVPTTLPRLRRPHWPANLVLGLDDNDSIWPFADERNLLLQRLQRGVGRALDARWLTSDSGAYRQLSPPRAGAYRTPPALRRWQPLFGGMQIIFSDLAGAADAATPDPTRAAALRRWLKSLSHGGTRTLILTPHRATATQLPAVCQALSFSGKALRPTQSAAEETQLPSLLALIAGFGFGTASLLRALAPLLAPGDGAIALAWAAWNHPHVQRVCGDIFILPAQQGHYEAAFAQLPTELLYAAWQRAVRARAVANDEALLHLLNLRCLELAPALADELAAASAGARRYFGKTLLEEMAGPERVGAEQRTHRLLHAAHPYVRAANAPLFQKLQAQACAARTTDGAECTIYIELGRPRLPGSSNPDLQWQLIQCGQRLLLRHPLTPGHGFSLATLNAPEGSRLQLQSGAIKHRVGPLKWDLPDLELIYVGALKQPLRLSSETHQLTLERVPRPSWASAWGRDKDGLWAESPKLGSLSARFRPVPGNTAAKLFLPGEGDQLGASAGPLRMGLDRFGAFVDLTVKGVAQRFRWIEPGEFSMGSPEGELDLVYNEVPRHRVRISQGFWLADTTCTQAFWLVVVGGENPAYFNDNLQNPVENVSWNIVNSQFLATLNKVLQDDLETVLPSEAQWEYACRAGTETTFSFGENITPEQVNYDGNNPYADAAKGINRRRTVSVKTLPPNDWGLYEMHGNVWEWCRDGKRRYTAANSAQMDPEGVNVGALRGGSCRSDARYTRAAVREAHTPGAPILHFGLRLLLRSKGPVRIEHKQPTPVDSEASPAPAVSERGGFFQQISKFFGRGT